jgi:hypothetical protein
LLALAAVRSGSRDTISDQDRMATSTALFATIFQQNWENMRGIKSERIWFLNSYSVIGAGYSLPALGHSRRTGD